MRHSEQIHLIASAMVRFQASLDAVKKDKLNPHFNSRYADLAACMEAIREPLAAEGLCIIQSLNPTEKQEVYMETRVLHLSGQWIAHDVILPVDRSNAQGYGSAITYARRYGLSLTGLVTEVDDDGNAATSAAKPRASAEEMLPQSTKTAGITTAQIARSREKIKKLIDKFGKENGAVKAYDILTNEFGAEHRTDLDEEQAERWLTRLDEVLEAAK